MDMNKNKFELSHSRLIAGIFLAVFLLFLLEPTAVAFYELYHLTGVNLSYNFYQGFKAIAYYYGVWDYRVPVSLLLGSLVAVPWFRLLRQSFRRTSA